MRSYVSARQAFGALSPCAMPDAVSASQFSNIKLNPNIKNRPGNIENKLNKLYAILEKV